MVRVRGKVRSCGIWASVSAAAVNKDLFGVCGMPPSDHINLYPDCHYFRNFDHIWAKDFSPLHPS